MALSGLDLSLANRYKLLLGLNNYNNINGDLIITNQSTVMSNLFISNVSILNNNVTLNSNIFVSSYSIINNLTSNSLIVNNNSHQIFINNDLNSNLINISGLTFINGSMTILTNLNSLENTIIQNGINCNNININNGIINNNITFSSNLYVVNNSLFQNLNPVNVLSVSGKTIFNSATIQSSLNVSNSSFFYGNVSILSNLYVSNNTFFNNLIGLSLNVPNSTIFNNNVSANSLIVSNETIINKNLNINTLSIDSNSVINGNLTNSSDLAISGITIFNNNLNVGNNLNIAGNLIVNNNVFINNNNISGNTNISLNISGKTNINNNININGNATFNSTLTISGVSTLFNINILGNIISQIPEYRTNGEAALAGVPLWSFYRTGGILKIRTGVSPPVITLNGSSIITVVQGQPYTELSVIAIDYFNSNIIPVITGYVNILQVGTYIITYTATDINGNITTAIRTVNVVLDTFTPTITLNGNNIIKQAVGIPYNELNVSITDVTSFINTYDLSNNYLYLKNDYSLLATSNWTFESWINLSASNTQGCIIDFSALANRRITLALGFDRGGSPGYNFNNEWNYLAYSGNFTDFITLNKWIHIAYQFNNPYLEIYFNGVYKYKYNFGTILNNVNFQSITLGSSINREMWQMYGSLYHLKISSNLRYSSTQSFIPQIDLTPLASEIPTTLFFLTNNYSDLITKKMMSYPGVPPINLLSIVGPANIIPTIIGSVNTSIPGKNVLTYSATDISGNKSNVLSRTVYVLQSATQIYYDITSNYLQLNNNYTSIITNTYWTAEGWIYLNSYSINSCFINFNNLSLVINSSGYLGYTLSGTLVSSITSKIPLNTWTHIVYQRNGIFLEFYINGTFISNVAFSSTTISNISSIILGNNNFNGFISQVRICQIKKYFNGFPIPYNISSTDSNIVFYLISQNISDLVTGNSLTYSSIPITGNREYYLDLPSTNITQENLVFNFDVSQLTITNQINTSLTWLDTTGNYTFQLHSSANNTNIVKVQNNYGWKRSGNTGFILTSTSNSAFQSLNWSLGLTLEQWIYIDYNFIPSNININYLAGQFSSYGFVLSYGSFPYNTYVGNMLSIVCSTLIQNSNIIDINNIRGSWAYLSLTISTTQLNMYLNGGLIFSISPTGGTGFTTSGNTFTLGCTNNGAIDPNSYNTLFFGNLRVYNKMLSQDEIINNYFYEKPLYILPTNGLTYTNSIPWTLSPSSSTIYTNYQLQKIIFNGNYLYKNYSVIPNNNYCFSLNVKLETATNFCIIATSGGTTWGTIGGTVYNANNYGLNTNTYKCVQYYFESKTYSNISIFIGFHNEPYLTAQTMGIVNIYNANLSLYNIETTTSSILFEPIALPLSWSSYNGSLPITENDKVLTITFNNSSSIFRYIYIGSFNNYLLTSWIKLISASNLVITITDLSNNILYVKEFNNINSGLNTNSYTLISFSFYTQLQNINVYLGAFTNYKVQSVGTILLANLQINNNPINNPDFYYTPASDINFIQPTTTIAAQQTSITNYDTTNGYLIQSVDLNKMRILPAWTIETYAYATSWGVANDNGYIIDFSSGSGASLINLVFGVTSSVANILPAITSDGLGRMFIYYSGDTITNGKWKINASGIVPLNTWNHLVWQKNNATTLQMFINGTSVGTFTITQNDWQFPNFAGNGLNSIIIGGSQTNPSAVTNHWKGRLSQPSISIGAKYISNFAPDFDLSLNAGAVQERLFLLQDNFTNNIIGQTMSNYGTIIPTYAPPTMNMLGNNPYGVFINLPYNDPGFTYNYYLRTKNLILDTISNVNSNVLGKYSIIYSIIDNYNNIAVAIRNVNVVGNLIPPTLTLNGAASLIIPNGSTFIDPGYSLSSATGEIITPIISGSVNTAVNGIYYITYTATDSSSNTTTVTRKVSVHTYTTIDNSYIVLDSIIMTPYQNSMLYTNPNIGCTFIDNSFTFPNNSSRITALPSIIYLQSINFKITSSWCFVFKLNRKNNTINSDFYFGYSNINFYIYAYNGIIETSRQSNISLDTSPLNNNFFASISQIYNLNGTAYLKLELIDINGNIIISKISEQYTLQSGFYSNWEPFSLSTKFATDLTHGIYYNANGYVDYSIFKSYFISPFILNGSSNVIVELNKSYYELGVFSKDIYNSNVAYTTLGTVDISTLGTYTISYIRSDNNNIQTLQRNVIVRNDASVITLYSSDILATLYGGHSSDIILPKFNGYNWTVQSPYDVRGFNDTIWPFNHTFTLNYFKSINFNFNYPSSFSFVILTTRNTSLQNLYNIYSLFGTYTITSITRETTDPKSGYLSIWNIDQIFQFGGPSLDVTKLDNGVYVNLAYQNKTFIYEFTDINGNIINTNTRSVTSNDEITFWKNFTVPIMFSSSLQSMTYKTGIYYNNTGYVPYSVYSKYFTKTLSTLKPPTIKLNGLSIITIYLNNIYTEQNASAQDSNGNNLFILVSETVDTTKLGKYTIVYTAIDNNNNISTTSRIVYVITPP